MLETVTVIALMVCLLVIAWAIGRFHIACVDPREVGRLTADSLNWRMKVYGVPAGAIVAGLAVSGPVMKGLPLIIRLSFVGLLALSLMFGFLIMVLSYLEAIWHKSELLASNARRRWLFNVFCLPILYSSLYLYWLTLIPAWLIFLVALMKAQVR